MTVDGQVVERVDDFRTGMDRCFSDTLTSVGFVIAPVAIVIQRRAGMDRCSIFSRSPGLRVTMGAVSHYAVIACALTACSYTAPAGSQPGNEDASLDPDGAPLSLVDPGLVVRYFMDEASAGTEPTELIDSAPDPLNLPITYGQAVYVDDGNRGLRWAVALGTGKVEAGLGTPKLSTHLRDASRLTMEVVVDVDGANGTTLCNIVGMRGSNPDFMLSAIGQTELRFHRPLNILGASWETINHHQRMVVHVVYDTTATDPERRIELYKNGLVVAKTTTNPPPLDSTLGLPPASEFMIGNNQDETRSIAGTIYYVAYYDQPLTADEVANNAARLLANDDR